MSRSWFRGCAPRPRTRRTAARPWLGRPQLEALEARTLLDTFLVSLTADSGPGSLRQAILNANATPGTNSIVFSIGGGGMQTIAPVSALPTITNPVVIDGTTQPGFAGTPLIVLDGSLAGGTADGLQITAGSSTVKGLAIGGFGGAGIRLQTAGANQIISNYLGTDTTGTAERHNAVGVYIDGPNNTVGGTMAGAGNLISGNQIEGIRIDSGSGNVLQGNRIGTDATGTEALPNGDTGVGIIAGSTNNTIGGPVAGAGNTISGNSLDGVFIAGSGTLIQGNFIGTDITGTKALANGFGVVISSSNNTVGGAAAGTGNLLSGNAFHGVEINTSGNLVQGNLIGTDITGTKALANGVGVVITNSNNTVGGTAAGAGNLISGNQSEGIRIDSGSGNLIQGNLIGIDVTGAKALANSQGVYITAGANTVGGTASGAGNTISGNSNAGVLLGGSGNLVQGNFIGTDKTGTSTLANLAGVYITASGNTVGGAAAGAGNLIAGNTDRGIATSGGSGNLVQGNFIGTNAAGTTALANGDGVDISSANNTLGGTATGSGNLISGNTNYGVVLSVSGSGNTVQGNRIGTDKTGTAALPNGTGVYIARSNNTVGGTTPGTGNTIAFNASDGVLVDGGNGNGIVHNAIFGHGGLGIHLINGGNNLQPFPTLTAASSGGGTTTIQGMLQSFLPNAWNTLEFFADTICNPSGFGEGERYLGTAKVKTDSTGNATFTVTFNVAVPPGQFVSATATTALNPGGNTSQFAACALATAGPVLGRGPLDAGSSDKALGHGAWPLDPVMIRAAKADPAPVVSPPAADRAGARSWRQPVVPDEAHAISFPAGPIYQPQALAGASMRNPEGRGFLFDTDEEDALNW